MSEILYLKFEKNIRTYNQTITIGEIGEMQCADSTIVNRLKTEKLYTFQNVKKGRRSCAARNVFSILDVVEKIQGVYPHLEIQNMGEQDFIVEYSTKHKEQPVFIFLKVAVVCLICFFGSAFSIMAFNNDVSTVDMFGQFYTLMTCLLYTSLLGLTEKPYLIKPNTLEFEQAFQKEIKSGMNTLEIACQVVNNGIPYLCLSMGADGAMLVDRVHAYRAKPVPLAPRGLTGAGDSMVAGMCYAIQKGLGGEDMLRYAMASAAGSIRQEGTLLATQKDIEELLPLVEIETVL